MIIDIVKIRQEGKTGDKFTFEYNPDNSLVSIPGAHFAGPVRVEADVQLEGRDVFADITLSYVISGECSRCLESASGGVTYSYGAKFSLFPQEEEYYYKGGKVDLEPCVEEALIVSQPTVIYCKEDCKGLCPVCGANLNVCDCGHGDN